MRKLKLLYGILLSLIMFSCPDIKGQEKTMVFDHLSVSEGLSNSVVNAICQDSYGFIWIGTDEGLNKYDGYNFHIYRHIPGDSTSLSSSFISSLYSDRQGHLWVGTQDGLSLFDPSRDNFKTVIYDVGVEFLDEDDEGNVIAGTNGGLRIIHRDSFSVESFSTGTGMYSNAIGSLKSIDGGGVLVNHYDRLIYYSHSSREELSFIEAEDGEDFISLTNPDAEGELFVLSSKRIIKLSLGAHMRELKSIPLHSGNKAILSPIEIFSGSRGTLYVSTKDQLYDCDFQNAEIEALKIIVNETESVSHNIEMMYEDRYGNLWLGEYGNGILLQPRNKNTFRHFEHSSLNQQSLSNNIVSAFAEDEEGVIWIGTWGGGLSYYDPHKQLVGRYDFGDEELNLEIFRGACFDGDQLLWLATNRKGLLALDLKTGRYQRFMHDPGKKGSLPSDNLYSVFSLKNGEIWTGHGSDAGMVRYDADMNSFDDFKNDTIEGINIPVGYVRVLIQNREGKLWFGTYGEGVHYVNFERSEHLSINSSSNPFSDYHLNNDVIYSLLEDRKGLLWIGTMGGGLNVLNPGTYQIWHIMENDGLANDVVNGILEDEHGNLWISTNNGISRFAVPEFLYSDTLSREFISAYDFHPHFLNYNIKDGLQNNEFKYASQLKSTTGEMYFGGISGFNVFHPDSIKINEMEPTVVLTGVSLFNQLQLSSLPWSPISAYPDDLDRIELKYNQNFISFDFIALNYNNSRKNRYEYLLEGFDDQWNQVSGDPQATYMNLKPGNYRFRVRASNNDGIWTSGSKDMSILIHPPLWGRLWFLVLIIFSILGILYSFYAIRLRRVKQRAHELEERVDRRTGQLRKSNAELEKSKKEVEDMAQRLHETDQLKLRFFTNISHEFRTPLTLIVGPVEKLLGRKDLPKEINNPLAIVYRNALRLLRLVNELLDIRKLDTGNINLQVSRRNICKFTRGLSALFEFHAKRRNISFSVESEEDSILLWFDMGLMEKVLYNLLSNAFKYTEDGGAITLQVRRGDGSQSAYVEIEVRDDGMGIPEGNRDFIFDRFYQVQGRGDQQLKYGSGIGLALCKEYMELHHGKILVESNEPRGSRFILLLKEGDAHFNRDQVLPEEEAFDEFDFTPVFDNEYMGDQSLIEDSPEASGKAIVMVVDDNVDMCSYVRDILGEYYKVLIAFNGTEGFDKAVEFLPDLILCDIMMPGMDGLELTRKLKGDERSSHIPVLLLSARASEEDRISGLELGADDYITKPFSSKVLLAKIQTVIDNRKKLKQGFKDNIGFDARSFVRTTPEDKFVARAVSILEDNLSNEDFNTEAFARMMGLSRAQLYRKILSTTDQSASEFIRSFRMRKALELLLQGDLNISEVAFSVGFKSLSHFTRTFTSVFGESPTQYLSKHKK